MRPTPGSIRCCAETRRPVPGAGPGPTRSRGSVGPDFLGGPCEGPCPGVGRHRGGILLDGVAEIAGDCGHEASR